MSTRTFHHRGLTLVEMLLSLAVTAVVGAALTSVISAVVSGVDARRDTRSHIVRAHAAQSRLASYILPGRAILGADNELIVLWFNDERTSDTVHGSEIRWIEYDSDAQTIIASFVRFPDSMNVVDRLLADREHDKDSNWRAVRDHYRSYGYLASITLVDGVSAIQVKLSDANPLASRHIALQMTLGSEGGDMTTHIAGSLRNHSPPAQ